MLKTIYHFFRLIRITNLLVIGLTMFVVEMFLMNYKSSTFSPVYQDYSIYTSFDENTTSKINDLSNYIFLDNINFYLIVISTLLIAAAGNIINDYFDVKADRINKPNRLIIGKYIKRRWAMVLHWSFNSLGLIVALYVGYVLQNVWIPLIAFLSINLLWFYSAYYKRKPFIGNVIVALLLGIIPLYVLIFNIPIIDYKNQMGDTFIIINRSYFIEVILILSGLAFCQNLVRELVKDIQDVRGDVRLGASTFPIKYGIKKTKFLISFIAVLTLCLAAFFMFYIFIFDFGLKGNSLGNNGIDLSMMSTFNFDVFSKLLIASTVLFLTALIIIIITNKTKTYKAASILLKVAMLCGLLTPLFL